MKASWYAEALYGALKGKNEKEAGVISSRFYEVIKSRGHAGLLRLIPAELSKIAEREYSKNVTHLVTATASSHAKWAHAYDHYEKEGIVPGNSIRHDVVDETIIGGFQIRGRNILIDGSYKKSLFDLYQKITTTNN